MLVLIQTGQKLVETKCKSNWTVGAGYFFCEARAWCMQMTAVPCFVLQAPAGMGIEVAKSCSANLLITLAVSGAVLDEVKVFATLA